MQRVVEIAWASSSLSVVDDKKTILKLRLQNLMLTTGYPMDQQRLVRRFGPAPHAQMVPPRGSEVYVSSLPGDAVEDEIFYFFRLAGDIYEIRLMLHPPAIINRGFCFVRFFTPEQANRAVAWLNTRDFRPGRKVSISKSKENSCLILTGIPRQMTKTDLCEELLRKGIRCKDVIVLKPFKTSERNRGYVFLDFACHEDAAAVCRRYSNFICLGNYFVKMEWAEPLPEVASDVMAKVTRVFLRNLDPHLKTGALINLLRGILDYGTISKVFKKQTYCFIHFHTRAMAETGLKKLQEYFLWTDVEVEWSKPPPKERRPLFQNLANLPQQASLAANSNPNCTKHKILENFISSLWVNHYETSVWCEQNQDANNNLFHWKALERWDEYWLGLVHDLQN